MENLFNIPGIKVGQTLPVIEGMFQFTEELRCKTYLNLAKAYAKNKKNKQSKELIDEAISEWAGSQFEVQVIMANSEIMVDTGDIKKALDILK